MQKKEMPTDTFFYKLTIVRHRLIVVKQKINSSKNIDEHEKIDVQQ